MHYRIALALTLVLSVFLTSLGLTVSVKAQQSSASSDVDYDHFLIYQADDGDSICREATPLEREQLERIKPKNLRQINHRDTNAVGGSQGDNGGTNLTIILRATANLDAAPDAKAAFNRAAANWEAVINSPVTIYLDADYGNTNFGQPWGSGVLGATSSPSLSNVSYSTVRSTLIGGANTPAKQAVYNALPTTVVPTDSGNVSTVSVSSSIARAIGLLNATAQPTDSAARIGFNSTFTFDFDPSDGITSGQTDFEAVATHEIGHALGFTSRSGATTPTPSMWDLYRFRSGTTDSTFTSANRIMTVGGPTINSHYYFVPGQAEIGLSDGGPNGSTDNNADGNQSSHWRQASRNGGVFAGYIGIMDPRIPSGIARAITESDTRALDVFGYNSTIVTPAAPPNDNFSAAQTVTGCAGTITGTNVGSTHESGEPIHVPGAGQRSVWYQWQAPASGPVQITTAGSTYDTVLAVYTGNSVNSLTPVPFGQSDDVDSGVILTSSVQFTATAGTTYRIVVDGFNNNGSGGDIGSVMLHWIFNGSCGTWSPTVLNPSQVELKDWTINGRTSIYAKLNVPDAGYRVANWASPVVAGTDFSVNATVEKFSGASAPALTNTAQIYDLGNIPAGSYTFSFKNSGTTVKVHNFTVSFAPPPPQNPIDEAQQFVTWQYRDFLRREPDGPGLAHWTNEITICSTNPASRLPGESEGDCIVRKRANTSAAFFMSPEFQNTGYFVLRVYRGSLGRMPHFGGGLSAGNEFTRDAATVSNGIVVNNQLSPSVINANKQAFVNEFVTRPEFLRIYGGMNNTQYVDKLFQTTGITPSAADRSALITEAGNSGGRASVLFKVVDGTTTINSEGHLQFNTTYGQAFYNAQFNPAFVQMEYFGYLLRDPDDAGYAFWLGKLNQFGNFVDAQMVLAFISSPEYRSRFGAP